MLEARSERRLKRQSRDSKKCAYRDGPRSAAKCSGEPLLQPAASLLEPPLPHLRVVARHQHVRDPPAPIARGARVVRVLGRALERRAVGLLDGALRVAEST